MIESLQKAVVDVEVLFRLCETGEFYQDYDESTETLGRAVAGFDLIVGQLQRWEDEARIQHRDRTKYKTALSKLVDLKDGPHDSVYRSRKPKAWAHAREVLGRTQESFID